MSWTTLVCDVMRVPPEPEPPPGSPPKVFRAAPNYFYLLLVRWVIGAVLFAFVAIMVTGVATVASYDAPAAVRILLGIVAIALWLWLAVHVLLGYAIVRLNWEMRWYMISDRAIRIREGIWSVKEKTITFANVQNIAVRQGPLERLLGIADVEVRTAGGGGASAAGGPHGGQESVGEPMHVGFFHGVANAPEIRDIVREGVRRYRDSGLGDHDERHDAAGPESASMNDVASALLGETRQLREMLERVAS